MTGRKIVNICQSRATATGCLFLNRNFTLHVCTARESSRH